ncbi:MAG: septum formation protein Maf [Clostridia bacterium]|nr:septum formation protein Maf [Clostridia bacterium]
MRLILASNSKRRKDLLKMVGWKYEVITSKVDEQSSKTNPEEYVLELSKNKAKSVAGQIDSPAIIISADTIVHFNNKIIEKPKSKQEAFLSIKSMVGKSTFAVTGVTIMDLYKNKTISFADKTEVVLRDDITDEDIKWYVENEKSLLDVSGYALLGKGAIFLKKVNGDYNTLFGISPSLIYYKLKELGYSINDFEIED